MSERRPALLLNDMLTCIEHIQQYTAGLSFDAFSVNYMVVEACLYNIQVIGEAVAKIPEDIIRSESQIPWSLIRSMRNRLIHQYFGTDLPLVWNVISIELPSFKSELIRIQSKLLEKNG